MGKVALRRTVRTEPTLFALSASDQSGEHRFLGGHIGRVNSVAAVGE
jgi:hypothetical protein